MNKHIEIGINNIRKQSISYKFFFVVILLFVWSWFAFNTENADYKIYYRWYEVTRSSGFQYRFEAGFSLSMLLGTKMGLNYNQWLMAFSGIGMFLMGKSFFDYCSCPCLALCLYFFYPYFFDIVQIRNFMAMAIVFFALRYLKKFSVKNLVTYICFVIASMFFHVTSFFAILYLIVYLDDLKKITKIIGLFIILFGFIYFINPRLINQFLLNFGDEVYIEQGSTLLKVLGYGVFAIIALVLSILYSNYCNNKGIAKNNDFYFLTNIMPIMCLTIILIGLSMQTYRFFRNIIPILYVVFIDNGVKIEGRKIKFNQLEIINVIFACYVSAFFFFHQLSKNAALYHTVTEQILNSNTLWR